MPTARDSPEAERWLLEAMDLVPGGIVIVDVSFKIVYWNRAAKLLVRTILGDVDPQEWPERLVVFLPDERTPLPEEDLPSARALRGEETLDVELFLANRASPGKGVHILCSACPMRRADGSIKGAASIFRDSTSRHRREIAHREKERQMRAILDNIPDIAWLKDREGRFLAVNQPFCEAAGRQSEQEILGLTDLDLWPRTLAERYRTDDDEIMRTGRPKRVEEPLVDASGKEIVIETIKTRIVSDGEVIGTTGIARDITERKRAEEALQLTKDELQRRVAEAQESLVRKERLAVLGQLAGGVAHQIRNPLAAIMNASYVLKRHLGPGLHPNVEDAIKIIHDEVRHANVIITGLLDHARVRTPDRHPTSLKELIDRVLASDWIPDNITIERVLTDVPQLEIDADQLHGALFNIVRNAVEAMPEGGTLRVELGTSDDVVVLAIADTGPGISAQVREHLFEPLHSTKPMGIGLGLVTARTFVEAHGGKIVSVAVPRGARFEIRLPLATPS